jgi:Helix-turn-helix domain
MDVGFIRCAAAQEFTGLGRSKLLDLAYRGDIPSVKCGRCRLFPVAGLRAWADKLMQSQEAALAKNSNENGTGAGGNEDHE